MRKLTNARNSCFNYFPPIICIFPFYPEILSITLLRYFIDLSICGSTSFFSLRCNAYHEYLKIIIIIIIIICPNRTSLNFISTQSKSKEKFYNLLHRKILKLTPGQDIYNLQVN